MHILDTERLSLRTISVDDAPFYLELVNSPGFLAHIGDRGIRTLAEARATIEGGPVAMQAALGHSIYLVESRATGVPVGMSGLIKRDVLDDVDLGYAFLPEYEGQGFASEAAFAVVDLARRMGMARLVAITSPGNLASDRVLTKVGMRFEKVVYLSGRDDPTRFYAMDLK